MSPQLWLGTDLRAPLAAIADRPYDSALARAHIRDSGGCFQLFQQQIAADDPSSYNPVPDWVRSVGENTYPNLVASGLFPMLKSAGVPVAFEGPALKNWNPAAPGMKTWTAEGLALSVRQAAHANRISIERIRDAGGEVKRVSIDDPYAAAKSDFLPALMMEQAVDAVAFVVREIQALGVEVGLTEAMPTCNAHEIIEFRERLAALNLGLVHIHLDIDLQHLHQVWSPSEIQSQLRLLRDTCRAWTQGTAVCRFGVIINGQRATGSPAAYAAETMRVLEEIRGYLGEYPDDIVLESWVTSDPNMAVKYPNGLPEILPESDPVKHTGIVNAVAQVTAGG